MIKNNATKQLFQASGINVTYVMPHTEPSRLLALNTCQVQNVLICKQQISFSYYILYTCQQGVGSRGWTCCPKTEYATALLYSINTAAIIQNDSPIFLYPSSSVQNSTHGRRCGI